MVVTVLLNKILQNENMKTYCKKLAMMAFFLIRNKFTWIIVFVAMSCFSSCCRFPSQLHKYMKSSSHPSRDTTYWQTIDMGEVLNVEYDTLYLISECSESQIKAFTHSDYDNGSSRNSHRLLLVCVKNGHVVYSDAFDLFGKNRVAFDTGGIFECYRIKHSTPVYTVKVDIIDGNAHYYLYNKELLDNGKIKEEIWNWPDSYGYSILM